MKYRKKPVVIEAIKFEYSKHGIKLVEQFVGDSFLGTRKDRHQDAVGQVIVKTLEGQHIANEGDMIIKGVAGEFYPCKPNIFEETYECAE